MLTLTARPLTRTGRQDLGCGGTGRGVTVGVGVGAPTGGGVGVGTRLGVGKTDRGGVTLCAEVWLEPPPPWFSSPTTTTISSTTINGAYSRRTLRGPRAPRSRLERREGDRRSQARRPARRGSRMPAGRRLDTLDLIRVGWAGAGGCETGAGGSATGAGTSGSWAGESATGAGTSDTGTSAGSGQAVSAGSGSVPGPGWRARRRGSGVEAASVARVSASSCGERRGATGPLRSPSRAMAGW